MSACRHVGGDSFLSKAGGVDQPEQQIKANHQDCCRQVTCASDRLHIRSVTENPGTSSRANVIEPVFHPESDFSKEDRRALAGVNGDDSHGPGR